MRATMQFPRWVWVASFGLLIVGTFFLSFFFGQRMIAHWKAPLAAVTPVSGSGEDLSKFGKPQKVEVYVPEPSPQSVEKPKSSRSLRSKSRSGYTAQVGAFKSKNNAWAERARLRKLGYHAIVLKRGPLYRVQIGYYRSLASAQKYATELKGKGIESVPVRY